MHMIGKWFGHIIRSMVQGCLVMAILAAIVSVSITILTTHKLPSGTILGLIIAIIIISGLLGSVALLAWRLSHIEELAELAKDVSQHAMHRPD